MLNSLSMLSASSTSWCSRVRSLQVFCNRHSIETTSPSWKWWQKRPHMKKKLFIYERWNPGWYMNKMGNFRTDLLKKNSHIRKKVTATIIVMVGIGKPSQRSRAPRHSSHHYRTRLFRYEFPWRWSPYHCPEGHWRSQTGHGFTP